MVLCWRRAWLPPWPSSVSLGRCASCFELSFFPSPFAACAGRQCCWWMLYFPLIIPKIAFLMLIYTDERTAFSGVFVANIGCTDVLLFPWLLAGFLALWLTVGGNFWAMLIRLVAQGPVLDSCCLAWMESTRDEYRLFSLLAWLLPCGVFLAGVRNV